MLGALRPIRDIGKTLGIGDNAPQKYEEGALANLENDLRIEIGFPIPMKRWGQNR